MRVPENNVAVGTFAKHSDTVQEPGRSCGSSGDIVLDLERDGESENALRCYRSQGEMGWKSYVATVSHEYLRLFVQNAIPK